MQEILGQLPGRLLPWYQEHRRDLPWRSDREPYHVWLSEIMLQQTRVEAVKGYYTRFLGELPRIGDLANCDEERLNKLWEGLGYYSRVRNLKKAAQVIMECYGGEFPRNYDEIRALPGIGDYTAGAVASIAFGQRKAAVDGNVLRVLSRLRADEEPIDLDGCKKRVRRELEEIYPEEDPGSFTQALMELGATVCLPNGVPRCESCPLGDLCRGKEDWTRLPVKSPRKGKRLEHRTVFVLESGGKYALEKRPERGLLAGLWQFPNQTGHLTQAQALDWVRRAGLTPTALDKRLTRPHIFTHIRWEMRCYYLSVESPGGGYTWMTLEEMDKTAALPTAFRQFREEI